MTQTHKIKCEETYFSAIERGEKNFEIRRDDRGYQKGDILQLEKFRNKTGMYVMDGYGMKAKPVSLLRRITYVLTGGQWGLEPGYVALALEHVTIDELIDADKGKD